MAEENAARRDWYEGSLDFPHFLSTARRLALEVRRVSEIHGLRGEARSGLETGGQRELSAEEREESRIEEAESVGRLEKDSRGGRLWGAREEGEREWRLRQTVTVWVGGEGGGRGARVIEMEMKWSSDICRGVTVGLEGEHFLTNTRSRRLPALWVGREDCREKSKEWSRGRKAAV